MLLTTQHLFSIVIFHNIILTLCVLEHMETEAVMNEVEGLLFLLNLLADLLD